MTNNHKLWTGERESVESGLTKHQTTKSAPKLCQPNYWCVAIASLMLNLILSLRLLASRLAVEHGQSDGHASRQASITKSSTRAVFRAIHPEPKRKIFGLCVAHAQPATTHKVRSLTYSQWPHIIFPLTHHSASAAATAPSVDASPINIVIIIINFLMFI